MTDIALGAAILMAALIAGTFLSRWYFVPASALRAAEDATPVAEFFRPAEVNDVGWCPAEQAERLHAYKPDGRECWTCRHFTPAGGGTR